MVSRKGCSIVDSAIRFAAIERVTAMYHRRSSDRCDRRDGTIDADVTYAET